MKAKLNINHIIKVLGLILSTVLINTQPVHSAPQLRDTQQQSEVILNDFEKIEVTGTRPLSFFRNEMRKAESDFYMLYNQLTSNRLFKIECKMSKEIGTHIKKRKCQPNFIKKEIAKATQDAIHMSGGISKVNYSIKHRTRRITQEYQKDITEKVNNNSQLKSLLVDFDSKRKKFLEVSQSLKNNE